MNLDMLVPPVFIMVEFMEWYLSLSKYQQLVLHLESLEREYWRKYSEYLTENNMVVLP